MSRDVHGVQALLADDDNVGDGHQVGDEDLGAAEATLGVRAGRAAGPGSEQGHRPTGLGPREGGRPLAGADGRAELVVEQRPGQTHGGEPRCREQDRSRLLGEHRVLEQAELRVQPAELRELGPAGRVPPGAGLGEGDHALRTEAVGEVVACRRTQQFLIVGEGEVHRGLLA
jgi:hypothetical protein